MRLRCSPSCRLSDCFRHRARRRAPELGIGLFALISLPAALLGACNPYERHSGEYLAGSVDPVHFPAAYLGNGGIAKMPGAGVFQYVAASVDGKATSYYPLPFNGAQASSDDPLDISGLDLPLAYIFDPQGGNDGAAADSSSCKKPMGYVYDTFARREDPYRMDRQGNIFTELPAESDPAGSSTYIPVVSEVVVTSNGNPCQDIKSEATLVTRTDVTLSLAPPTPGVPGAKPTARPSGRLLAMAIIDPAGDVRFADPNNPYDPMTRLGPQRYGFYGQYLLAYLDGGYIPQQIVYKGGGTGGDVTMARRLVTQDIYYPAHHADGQGQVVAGALGQGFDVLQFRRGNDGYSPVCRVRSFEPADPMHPETSVAAIDPATVNDDGKYIYCLQLP
jgi:hypothetical protein